MKSVIQRVSSASVTVDGQVVGEIQQGLLVLIGFTHGDNLDQAKQMLEKIQKLRIFSDEQGKMNKSVLDIKGEILLVSQFTLYADCQSGNRPSFTGALPPQEAALLYNQLVQYTKNLPITYKFGIFGADMKVALVNDGPVTVILDS